MNDCSFQTRRGWPLLQCVLESAARPALQHAGTARAGISSRQAEHHRPAPSSAIAQDECVGVGIHINTYIYIICIYITLFYQLFIVFCSLYSLSAKRGPPPLSAPHSLFPPPVSRLLY